jgi:hypothetical protein
VVSEARLILVAPLRELVRRTPDDSWYYLGVARNLAAGHGPTFDGHGRTNGFQPVWQFVEAALATVWHGTALARAGLLAAAVLTVAAVALATAVTARVVPLGPVGIGLVAVLVASPPVWSRLCDGMETPTVLATLAVLAAATCWWWPRPTARRMAAVGLASGLCCLARTSTAVVVVLVPVVLAGWGPDATRSVRGVARQVAGWLAGAVAITLPWLAWSWIVVGSPVQVSSRVKWHWARAATGPVWSGSGLHHAWAAVTEEVWRQVRLGLGVLPGTPSLVRRAVEVVAVVVVVVCVVATVRASRRVLVVVVPGALLVARVVVEFVTFPTLVSSWYAAPVLVVSAIVAAALADGVGRRTLGRRPGGRVGPTTGRAVVGVAVIVVGVGIAVLPSGRPSGTWGIANLEAGRELAHLGGRAGAFDDGVVGWVHPGTVDLDGLVRSPVAVDRLLVTPPGRVAIADRITHLVGRMAPHDPRVPACARLVWTSPTTVSLPGQGSWPVRIWSLTGCG